MLSVSARGRLQLVRDTSKKELAIIICLDLAIFEQRCQFRQALIRSADRQSVIFDTTIQRRQGARLVSCGQRLLGGESAENLRGSRQTRTCVSSSEKRGTNQPTLPRLKSEVP